MIPDAAFQGSDIVAAIALVGSAIAGITAFARVGTERQTAIVGAQDVVIDNLREEVERHKLEREFETEKSNKRVASLERAHDRAMVEVHQRLADEAESCERRISKLEAKIEILEAKLSDGS